MREAEVLRLTIDPWTDTVDGLVEAGEVREADDAGGARGEASV